MAWARHLAEKCTESLRKPSRNGDNGTDEDATLEERQAV